jgi:hypothetical protein
VLVGLLTPSWGANKAEEDHLIYAAQGGDLGQVKSLIAAGVDVNAKDNLGYTALIYASLNGHVEVVQALLAAKADVNAKENLGNTALIWASAAGHVEVVRALLAAKADVNAKNNSGSTALMWASSIAGRDEVVKLLRQATAVAPQCAGYHNTIDGYDYYSDLSCAKYSEDSQHNQIVSVPCCRGVCACSADMCFLIVIDCTRGMELTEYSGGWIPISPGSASDILRPKLCR